MNPSQRISLNATATYARAVFAAGLALFSSRWVLNALGQTDFGLFSLVGSIIGFVTFLNIVMASSTGRHFAYSIGQGDPAEVNRWFNAALGIHLGLAAGLVLIGLAAGEYVVAYVLTIPAERLPACRWVFRVSLLSAFTSMASIPFIAMFNAQQHIAELAVWGTLQSIFTFTLAYILTHVSGDRLLFYAVGMVIILVLIHSAQIVRAVTVFRECHIVYRLWFDGRRFKDIVSFAVWNLIGIFGGTLRGHGSAVLLNLYFGPRVNAAYGIASQVSSQTDQLAAAMLGALSPEITASEGRGDRARMINYSLRACKFGSILIMLFAIPVMAEMDYILNLWLGEAPPYTAPLCQLILCTFLVDRLSAGYMLAVNAHGRIAGYQATVGTSLLLTLPLAWFFLWMGLSPTSMGVAFVITMIGCTLGRVLWARHLFRVPVRRWLSDVILPCALVMLAATLAAVVPCWLLPSSFLRLALTAVAGIAVTLLTTWFLALDPGECAFVRQNTQRLWSKIRRRRNGGAGPLPPRPEGKETP